MHKVLDLAAKFKILKVCEVSEDSESKIDRHYNLTSSTLRNPC
jgi:hypothetical protein